jgi:hypothetical protein
MDASKPILCTLTSAERHARKITWHDVMRSSVVRSEEHANGFVLTLNYGTIGPDEIRKLVDSERDCCRWMDLELSGDSQGTLSIMSESRGGKAVIKKMLGL